MPLLSIITFSVLSAACLVGLFIANARNKALSNKWVILCYLGFAILLSAGGLVALSPTASRSMTVFVLLQLGYLGFGYLAAWLFRKAAPSAINSGKASGVWFVLANAFLGMVGFTVVYYLLDHSDLAPWFALSVLPFVLPQFLRTAFEAYRSIPHDIHKIWYYPIGADEVDYDHVDTSTIYMLELEYSKGINDPRLTNTKLRAPVSMNFGDWFRSFIENYNYKYESDPIRYQNADHTPMGWIFYTKPGLLKASKFIDPDRSIAENKISEKDIIQAKRVALVEEPAEAAY